MAGDWFPMAFWRSRAPEVVEIASATGRDRHHVLGLLCDFWSYVSTESVDGTLKGVRLRHLGSLVGGDDAFWRAVQAVNWLAEDDHGLVVPGWEVWLSESAKKRFKEQHKKRRQRAKTGGQVEDKRTTSKRRQLNGGGVSVVAVGDRPAADSGGTASVGTDLRPGVAAGVVPNLSPRPGDNVPPTGQDITDTEQKKNPPPNPPPAGGGQGGCVVRPPRFAEVQEAWNGLGGGIPACEHVAPLLHTLFSARCLSVLFCERWPDGIAAVRRSPRCHGATGWTATLKWFLTEGSLEALLNGEYDPPAAPPGVGGDKKAAERRAIVENAKRKAG